jgi:hypothetical protein
MKERGWIGCYLLGGQTFRLITPSPEISKGPGKGVVGFLSPPKKSVVIE